jgi:hypothetical protein
LALALAAVSCGGPGAVEAPRLPPLHLAPSTDLAAAAGLSWLLDVTPRALASNVDLLPALETALPHDQVAAFAQKNGFDPFSLDELVVASYAATDGESMLYVARGALEPSRLESSFKTRAEAIDGRAVDRPGEDGGIVRSWGTLHGDRAQLATFGHEAAALEIGHFGPLRVAELFAQEKLHRASPALRTGPLGRAAELLREAERADAPARAFALGPFGGDTAKGLGGLLAASTAVGIAMNPLRQGDREVVKTTLILIGGWGDAGKPAAERLKSAFDALSATGLGRLAGLDRPVGEVQSEALPDALRLTVMLDPVLLARAARAALGAEVAEIMSY